MKKTWLPFEPARAYMHTLGLTTVQQWYAYSKSGQRPADIPGQPYKVYAAEWQDWYDWLGIPRWLPFEQARAHVRELGLTSRALWGAYCQSGNKPIDIPADPAHVYAAKWQGLNDWLGIQDKRKKSWLPFEQARAHVHRLGLTTTQQWEEYSKSGQRPADIPSSPARGYTAEWQGWYDWLGVQRWLPFEQARAHVRERGLTTQPQWQIYCASGNRPADIPSDPVRVYAAEWQGWDDWFGRAEKSQQQRWRDYLAARAFVRGLGLTSRTQWGEYCQSGSKPDDIPSRPSVVYTPDFQGWEDWLGLKGWRSFESARAFVRALGFTSKVQWEVYAASEEKPADIPSDPEAVYDEFKEYQDWLGMRKPGTGWRPFEEARAYAQAQGFTTIQQWREHSKARKKPRDIPSDPPSVYGSAFCGWEDWLGKPGWRPFEEARAFVRALGFTGKVQWVAYAKSKEKPSDIPSSPADTYSAFRGYQDWLGIVNLWNKKALLALLQDLRASIASLQEHELYAILDRSGAFPGLCGALQTSSTQRVFRDLRENGGRDLEAQLTATPNGSERPSLIAFDETLVPIIDIDVSRDAPRSFSVTEEGLRALDTLASLPGGLDDEIIESLIANRVSALWEYHAKEGWESVDAFLSKSGGNVYFEEVKRRYLAEKAAVEMLPVPPGWAFTDDQGTPCAPNLMQRRIAWLVRERRRVGNWSGVGTGKTLSAILASRIIDARITLLIVANVTVEQWEEQIYNAYPDSIVYRDIQEEMEIFPGQHCYLLLNYEKFQGANRGTRVALLSRLCPDFIVFDEIQFVKQRGKEASHRREALEVLMQTQTTCAVLGMSATPVINDLREAKTLLELTIGLPFEIGTKPTVSNALGMHRLLLLYGIRNHPSYDKQNISVRRIKAQRNDLVETLLQGGKNLLKIEQVLLGAKLDVARPYFRKGMLVYIHYIDEIVASVQQYLEAMGFTVGRFTGSDKSGLELFKQGFIDILIGSRAVSIGIDGLQKRCDGIVMLSLPWTDAAYEQIVGRVCRQGSLFHHTEVIIPQIFLQSEGESWSWDEKRAGCIEYKRTLSDCLLEGLIPDTTQINQQEFLRQSHEALEQWIARVQRRETP